MRSAIATVLAYEAQKKKYTNKIRNPRGEGGTVGVIGSGGVLPTNWAVEQAMSGVATSFLGAGISANGLPYVDIGLSGTLSGANALIIRMEAATYATATAGQAWGLTLSSNLQTGTATGLSTVKARIRDSAALVVGESVENGLTGTSTLLQAKGVVSGAATSVYPRLVVDNLNNGAAVSATIRIYAPKLVQIAAIEGPELISNGDFATDTVWTKGIGATIAAGKGSVASAAALAAFEQAVATGASVYKHVFTVLDYVSGTVRLELRATNTVIGTDRSANGTYTDYLFGGVGNTVARYRTGTTTSLSIDNASLKLVSAGYMPTFPILPPVGVIADSVGYGIAA